MVNHVSNKHDHNNAYFAKCLHGTLEGRDAQKKWIKMGSKAAIQLENICLKKSLLNDIAKLSGDQQTWNLEAFHSLLNHFSPKMYYFSPIGMECRVKVAALHYNENAGRDQHVTSSGSKAFQIRYPKYKKGGYIVRKVLKCKTYNYINDLWDQVIHECEKPVELRMLQASKIVLPPTLCENCVHPNKEDAIRQHSSRYEAKK